jgi:cytosine deaminase
VDEGLGDYNALEMICDVAIATGFEGPILCGHAVSLIDRHRDDLARITAKLQRAGIAVCALPTTNLYLQGRRDGTPDRRGITRLRELQAAGVPVLVGSDNVADAFCPLGQHDPRAALHLAALATHLDPPMGQWLPAITSDATVAMGLGSGFIEDCPTDAQRLCAVSCTADLVAGRAPLVPISQATEEHPQ